MKPFKIVMLATVAAAIVLPGTPAHAGHGTNAVNVCQGALPNFEGSLRKRPLGVNNEGASTAFVSCSTHVDDGEEIISVNVLFHNRNEGTAQVSCTMVSGLAQPFPQGTPVYLPKTFEIAAGQPYVASWQKDTDNGGTPFYTANLSCALPPGIEINTLTIGTTPV